MNQPSSRFRERLPWVVSLGLVLVCAILAVMTYLGVQGPDATDELNEASFFSNIASPFIAMAAAVITFAAFWIQYQANREMRTSLQKQEAELNAQKEQQSIDRFEKIFFELVQIYRENVRDIAITLEGGGTVQGNKAIKAFLTEVEVTYGFMRAAQTNPQHGLAQHTPFQLASLAFVMCYEGRHADAEGKFAVNDLNLPGLPTLDAGQAQLLVGQLHTYLDHFYAHRLPASPAELVGARAQVSPPSYPTGEHIPAIPGYRPGQGFRDQMSTYFRHLFHAFKYLDDERQLTAAQKRGYASMLRAHISDEAQALLYYNSLSIWGHSWWGGGSEGVPAYPGMIMQHELLRNVPLDQIDPAISPLLRAAEWFGRNRGNAHPTREMLYPFFHYLEDPRYYEWAFQPDQTPQA